jgi:hypothetical protein
MSCESKLAGEFVRICGYKPKQGIKRKWAANWDDIDHVATQKANRNTKVTLLVMKTDKKFYVVGGNDKSHKGSHALAVGDYGNGYIHTDNINLLYRGENERERVQEIVDGARVVTLIEKVDGGEAGELSYEILGLESGMVITEDTWNSSENSGTTNLTLATKEGEEESTGAKLFLPAGGAADITTFLTANVYVAPDPEV